MKEDIIFCVYVSAFFQGRERKGLTNHLSLLKTLNHMWIFFLCAAFLRLSSPETELQLFVQIKQRMFDA